MQHYNVARLQCSASASDGIRSTKQTTAFMLNVGSDCARAAADERCCLAGTRARAQVHPEGSREWSGQASVERVRRTARVNGEADGIGAITSGTGPRVSGNGARGKDSKREWDDGTG